MARRFLHLEREKHNVPHKITEYGESVPIIGGRYYPVPKALISWRGLTVATVQANEIVWQGADELLKAFGRDFKHFVAADFLKAWSAFLG